MLTPQKAADRAGVSRRTVMLAIEGKRLNAIRNNRNRWQISIDDLDAWAANREPRKTSTGDSADTKYNTSSDASLEVTRLEEQLKAAKDQISFLEAQREKEAALYQDLMFRRDADYREALELLKEAQRRRGLLEWLTGRRKN